MVKGFDVGKRNLTLLMNQIADDVAKRIKENINVAQPLFNAKVERRSGDDVSVSAVIKGQAEISKDKNFDVDKVVQNAIKNALGDE